MNYYNEAYVSEKDIEFLRLLNSNERSWFLPSFLNNIRMQKEKFKRCEKVKNITKVATGVALLVGTFLVMKKLLK